MGGEVGELMAVRVRMFASLRAAAGEDETSVPAGELDVILQELRERYPPPFADRLAASSVLIDGTVAAHAGVHVPDGSEVALLPPVSGGDGRVLSRRCGRSSGCDP